MTHLDSDVLAEFRAGLITGRRGARIAAHLAGCERCTSLDDQLARVSALLASVPAPPLPDHVAQRLDTVLAAEVVAAEAAKSNNPERAGRDGAGESAAPRRPRGNRGFRLLALRVLAPAAGVVLLAAGVFGLSRLSGGSTSSSPASKAEGAPSAVSSTAQATAGARSASGRVNAPAAAPNSRPMTPASFVVVTSPANFTHAGFGQQVAAALTVTPAAGAEGPPSPQIRACVQMLAGHAPLIRVESARYEGQPATLVVIGTASGREALIAGEKCSVTTRDVLAQTPLPSGISGP
jgi:hypothetical protein